MKDLNGAALISHLQKQGREFSRKATLQKKWEALQKMQSVYREHKRLTALDKLVYRMNAYAGIAKASIVIAFYIAPCIVLGAVTVKAIHWILF